MVWRYYYLFIKLSGSDKWSLEMTLSEFAICISFSFCKRFCYTIWFFTSFCCQQIRQTSRRSKRLINSMSFGSICLSNHCSQLVIFGSLQAILFERQKKWLIISLHPSSMQECMLVNAYHYWIKNIGYDLHKFFFCRLTYQTVGSAVVFF